jgi:maleate cis-trans isomerase
MHNDVDKRRIGLILPSVNIRMEPELNRCKELGGFNFYATRVMLDDTTEETLKAMEKDLIHAADMIATVFPEAVVYGCTSGSFIQGESGNSNIIDTIAKRCKCPVVTASQAMIDSIKAVGAKNITLVTPYTDDINEKERKFFESNGIRVNAMKGLQIVPAEEIRTQSVESIENLVISTDRSDSDAVFISCTNVEGFHICDGLEKRLNKPVVTSNVACLWSLLRSIPNNVKIENRGLLLREYV